MFRNRHVIIAMLVAPILAILAWFAVGSLWGERPAPAQSGQSYPLVERSNCRYASGACDLENNDLRLTLRYRREAAALELETSHAMDSVFLAIVDAGGDSPPQTMMPMDEAGKRWRLPLASLPEPQQRIRLVASAANVNYFADAATSFLQPRDNASGS